MSLITNCLSMLAPANCQLCGEPLVQGEEYICAMCASEILPVEYHHHSVVDNPLRRRLPRTAPIANIATLTHYTHQCAAARLIRHGKYDNRPQLIAYLSQLLSAHLLAQGVLRDVDMLIPVPMYWWKRLRRGYNQAQIIAQVLHRDYGITLNTKILRAIRGHSSQTRQSAEGRTANLRNSFVLVHPEAISDRHIAIVDDILTTGSTISEVINTLLPAGPRAITIITLAATPPC